jgi:L-lactate dehydrogenase complex protein LldG
VVEVEERLVTSAREEILRRIRRATYDVPKEERPEDVPVERGYRKEDDASQEETIPLSSAGIAKSTSTLARRSSRGSPKG